MDGEAYFYPDFFPRLQSDLYLKQLKSEVPWKQEPIKIFGKEVMQPRLTAWYGDIDKAYSYSGYYHATASMDPIAVANKDSHRGSNGPPVYQCLTKLLSRW